MADIEKLIKKLKTFDTDLYKGKIGRDYLVLYSIWTLRNNNIEGLFDYIVVVAHMLFPEAGFSLTRFKSYPDARTVRDTIWHLKDEKKRWVEGNTQSGYVITKRGELILNKVMDTLKTGSQISQKKRSYSTDAPSKQSYWINEVVKKSDGFKKFMEDKAGKISSSDIRLSIGATSNVPNYQLKSNLDLLLNYAKDMSDKNVEKYLLFLKEKLED